MNDIKYLQLQNDLKAELKSGRFQPGDRFYTDKEIMEKYSLSSVTVTRALSEMASKGYFERRRKLGTFVLESPEIPGMSGDIMTKPLYVNGREANEYQEAQGPSWFVVEEIRRGIINNFPGAVRIVPIDEIATMLKDGEDIMTVLYHPSREFFYEYGPCFRQAVVINTRRDFWSPYNSVSMETTIGVYEAITHLVRAMGHTRVGYIGGGDIFHTDRYAGYRIALDALKIPFESELVLRDSAFVSQEYGEKAMNQLLALPEPPAAVFVDTDWKALGAIEAIRKKGLKVPEDISVIGFDDMPSAKSAEPPLTTVRVPLFEIGKAAVEMLLEKLRTGSDIASRELKSELIIRNTTARRK